MGESARWSPRSAGIVVAVLAALTLTLALAVVPFVRAGFELYPRCDGLLVADDPPDVTPGAFDEIVPLGVERDGFAFRLERDFDADGRVVWARLARVGEDELGQPVVCGSVVLRDAGVSAEGGAVRRAADGALYYRDGRWGVAGQSRLRVVGGTRRTFQPSRLGSPRLVPALLAALGLASAFGALRRARRAIAAAAFDTWTDALAFAGGRVESPDGQLLGLVEPIADAADAADAPRPVVVSPHAGGGRASYRSVPRLAPGDVAPGTREAWLATARPDAKTGVLLAILGLTACCAGVVSALGQL